jgi:hypothetical protein
LGRPLTSAGDGNRHHTAKLQDLLQGLLHPISLVMDYKAVTRL